LIEDLAHEFGVDFDGARGLSGEQGGSAKVIDYAKLRIINTM
jgi:hypothetical protein